MDSWRDWLSLPFAVRGAPFCAVAVVLAGSIAGGVTGGQVADTLDDELEEFSRWNIA